MVDINGGWGGRERDGEGQVCETKPRKHQFISSSPPSSVTLLIGIYSVTVRILIEVESMVLYHETFIGDRLYCYIESYIGKY